MGIQDTLTLVMALVGGIATAWFMVRDVVPLAIRAIRRHRKRCADRKARLAAENQKQEKREEADAASTQQQKRPSLLRPGEKLGDK